MKMIIKWLVFMGGVLACSGMASAQEVQWSDSARLALGQCLVAEAGWRKRTEHAAIAHVLMRNWHRFVRARPGTRATFESRVRAYCAVHRVRTPSPRQRWVRNLEWGAMDSDPGMGDQVNWRNYAGAWDYVRETVSMFEAGELEDPLPDAIHWGGVMDGVPTGGVLLARVVGRAKHDTEDEEEITLRNRFYDIDYGVVRRIRAHRAAQESDRTRPIPVSEIIGRDRT